MTLPKQLSEATVLASAISLPEAPKIVILPKEGYDEIIARVGSLESNQEILFGIIAKLKAQITPQPSDAQADRATVLKALLASNNGKMFAKDARQRMHVEKSLFSRLLLTMKDVIEVRPFHADRRMDLIILRSENG
jgi:hypothetical protein